MTQTMEDPVPIWNWTEKGIESDSGAIRITGVVISDEEIQLQGVGLQPSDKQKKIGDIYLPEPVYVKSEGEYEHLIYNSARMELNKLYPIIWNGQNYALRKTAKEVEILKFYPDE